MTTLLIIHFAVTWALVGLIWTIQAVHYPLFKDVGRENFIDYHERHMSLITWVVGPLMLVEAASAAGLLYLGERSVLFCVSLVMLAVVWVSTWLFSVPLHYKLTGGFDTLTIQRLVCTNLWRTLGWTIRGLCLGALLISRLNQLG